MPTKANPTLPTTSDEITLERALQTLEELSRRLEKYEQADQEKDKIIQTQATEIRGLKSQAEGWLITTPSSTFNGAIFGLQFVNGLAFVPKSKHFPEFVFKPMDDIQKERYFEQFRTPEKLAKARRDLETAEARTTAEIAVHNLQYDRGFKVEWIGVEDGSIVENRKVQRAREAALEQEQINQALKDQLEKVSNPQVFAR